MIDAIQRPHYQRVLIKLSGEFLKGRHAFGFDPDILARLTLELGALLKLGVQVGLVIGGGNFFRGRDLKQLGIGRLSSDQMGMLATVLNAFALRDACDQADLPSTVMSAIAIPGLLDYFEPRKALSRLNKGQLVIFAGGTGNPFCSTDSAASLRAIEIGADILLKGTQVSGVYSRDPKKHPDAIFYEQLSYDQFLQAELGVMDLSAVSQCRDYQMKMQIFDIQIPGLLLKIIMGEPIGTLIA